ncbi:MAG: D-alanyl-D-alanine carboxypeptidase family protein, partial [Alphaproteobacteria bacterium]|nr:D-alanyl-D-alanine carboxypeptidase family protein [Alphaproteobacteria bacterium]
SYETQRATWPVNLKKYLLRLEPELAQYRASDGRYSDEAVCVLRQYASQHYAFPGYSHHQSGRAADFHARLGDGPELDSNSGSGSVGGTGKSNIALWCESPVFAWLHVHAREYGFVQAKIDEPWHWVYDPDAAKRKADADYVATSCQR